MVILAICGILAVFVVQVIPGLSGNGVEQAECEERGGSYRYGTIWHVLVGGKTNARMEKDPPVERLLPR